MKVALLNMPNAWPVMRRYMCSTTAETYLFPPQELMYLAAVAEKQGHEISLIDAIAEKLDYSQTLNRLKPFSPDMVVSITGFECFENDMKVMQKLKKDLPKAKTLCFGYYPTIFPKEIMQNTSIDFLILGEPELVLENLLSALAAGKPLFGIKGLAFRKGKAVSINKVQERIKCLDSLPFPKHSLLKQGFYSEPFLGAPFTAIQSSRGCPFQCTYCVSTYGSRLFYRSPENILEEIKHIASLGIKNFRFIDDTFTVDKARVKKLCGLIAREKIKVQWTCLSRADSLEKEMLEKMKAAGCKRIFIGVESGSQKILDYFSKGYKLEGLAEKLSLVHETGIESLGFFIVGSPLETVHDFEASVELAKKSNLDYVVVSRLMAYPGTPLFQKMRSRIGFRLFPYRNEFRDKSLEQKWENLEKKFYKKFYLRPSYILGRLKHLAFHPAELLMNTRRVLSFVFSPAKPGDRQDLF